VGDHAVRPFRAQAILDASVGLGADRHAARQLFTERGYAATPMTAIADRAGVALDTVYASVGRKPELARLLIETAISGTDQAIPAEQRDYVRAIRAAPDAGTKIAIYAAATAAIAPRLTLVLAIIQQAAPGEPELAALWAEIAERRAANMRLFVADLATVAPLRLDPDEAADIVWATSAAETYQLLVGQRGWSPQRYERFLADTWHRLLLAG
jgi:AcrR family transcriptional regulator